MRNLRENTIIYGRQKSLIFALLSHFNDFQSKMTSWRCFTCWPVKLWRHKMMSLVNKSADWTPNYHKILIFSPPKSLKRLRAARIDQLADSNEPAINTFIDWLLCLWTQLQSINKEAVNKRYYWQPFYPMSNVENRACDNKQRYTITITAQDGTPLQQLQMQLSHKNCL